MWWSVNSNWGIISFPQKEGRPWGSLRKGKEKKKTCYEMHLERTIFFPSPKALLICLGFSFHTNYLKISMELLFSDFPETVKSFCVSNSWLFYWSVFWGKLHTISSMVQSIGKVNMGCWEINGRIPEVSSDTAFLLGLGRDFPPLLHSPETCRGVPQKWSVGWSTYDMKKDRESGGSWAWRRESPGEPLWQPLGT